MISENTKSKGDIEMTIKHVDGQEQTTCFTNAVLHSGREALAAALANNVGDGFDFYVNRMLFGDGGTSEGVPRFVDSNRDGLYGVTRASKNVIASIDPAIPSQVIFTSVLGFDEANGFTINEMALKMANGHLYSMATFPDQNKTSSIQITWTWRISFV